MTWRISVLSLAAALLGYPPPPQPAPVTLPEMLAFRANPCANLHIPGYGEATPFLLSTRDGRNAVRWPSLGAEPPHLGSRKRWGDTVVVVVPQDSLALMLLPIGHTDSILVRIRSASDTAILQRGTAEWCGGFRDAVIR